MKKKLVYWINISVISAVILATAILAIVFTVQTHKFSYYDCGLQDKTTFTGSFEGAYPKKHRNGTETYLLSPQKDGYTFEGWFTNYAGTGNKVTKISKSEQFNKNINLYAKWSPSRYVIEYRDLAIGQQDVAFSGEHESTYPITHIYGTETVLDTPTKTGYAFKGYFLQNSTAGGKVTSLSATGYTADITLYALWVTTLDAPTGLAFDKDAMTLSWNAVNNAVGYNVYDGSEKLNTTPITGTSFTVGTRPVGTCRFTVVAVSVNTTETMDFNSAPSEEVTYIVEPEESSYTNKIDVSADGKTALGFYDKNSGTLTILGEGRVDESIIDKINAIGEDEARNITTIDLSNSAITTIDKDTFGKFTGITNIQSGSSVKTIGSGAFYMCDTLETVDLPEGIIYIGDRAFRGCTNLSDINLPDTVTSIGREAFYNCTKLGEIVIPGSVKKVPTESFYGCTWLKSVIMEDGVEEIGYSAFRDCTGLSSVVFPETLTRIEEYAFYYAGDSTNPINDIVFSDSLLSIGSNAFSYAKLKNITLGNGVTELRTNTFFGASLNMFKAFSLKSIEEGCFQDIAQEFGMDISACTELKEFKAKVLTTNCVWTSMSIKNNNLTFINLPNSIKIIEAYTFSGSKLKNIEIPDAVTEIEEAAFDGCENLSRISIPNSVTQLGDYVLMGCTSLVSVTLPENLYTISIGSFWGCTSLGSITIPSSVTIIERMAFDDCSNLTSVQCSPNLAEIGQEAFIDCKMLNTIDLSMGVNLIGKGAFQNCTSLTDVTLSENVVIGDSAFYQCSNLLDIKIPASVRLIGTSSFSSTPFLDRGVTIDDLLYVTAMDGVTKILIECNSTKTEGIVIDPNTKIIAGGAFLRKNITSIEIPDNVTGIGNNAFYQCSKLTSIILPSGVEIIGSKVFLSCSQLVSIELPDSVTEIGDSAFQSCNKLTLDKLPNNLVSIGASCFEGSAISISTIPSSVNYIGDSVFNNCTNITELKILANVKSIGSYVFQFCSNLTKVEILNPITSIGKNAFSYCKKLVSINLPEGLISIGDYAFNGCNSLGDITLPSSLKAIGERAFNQVNLSDKKLTISEDLESIGNGAFDFYPTSTSSVIMINNILVANSLEAEDSCGSLIDGYRGIIYIKSGLDVSNSTYLLSRFTKQETSDISGYDKYIF